MKNKKADISMNTIIAAAIAMVVLIVIVMIFSGRISVFSSTLQSCESQKGICSDRTSVPSCSKEGGYIGCIKACPNENNYVVLRNTDCEDNGKERICCKPIIY